MKKFYLIITALVLLLGSAHAQDEACGTNFDGSTAYCANDAGWYCSFAVESEFGMKYCVNVFDDPTNCGWVGNVCPTGLNTCWNGTCMACEPGFDDCDDYGVIFNAVQPQPPLMSRMFQLRSKQKLWLI